MRGLGFQRKAGTPRRRAWLPILVVPLAIALAACGDSDDDDDGPVAPPMATRTVPTATRTTPPVPTPTPDALAACEKLDACGQCFTNERGACVDSGQCAQRLSRDETSCVTGVTGCGTAELADCLDVGCGGADSVGPCEMAAR